MSVFKTKWIILKINKPKDKDFLYTLFTYDFGKILVSKKKNTKEKTLDLGYIINSEVRTKESINIHRISNIKIISEFDYENKPFKLIEDYMKLLSLVLKNTPDWSPIFEIFTILETVNNYKKITSEKLCLARLKILNCLWNLDIQHKDQTTWKILKYIDNNSINDILRLTWIDDDTYRKLLEVENNLIS